MKIDPHNFTDEFRLIYAGSVNKNKNIVKVINAIEKLRDIANISISIFGKGSLYKKIEEMCKTKRWILIKPWIKKEELLNEYRKSHLFVMPSIHETFGLVYLEALSQGLPIIHSKNQGIDGFFDNLKLVRKVDPSIDLDIYQTIKNIIENYNNLGFGVDLNEFKWKNVANQYVEIYSLTKE